MKTILHKLARIGLREDLNPYEAKRIQVFNYSNLFGFIASLTRIIYISFFSVNRYTELTILVNMLPLVLCIVMGTCMYYQKYKTATYLSFLCFPPVILMMYVSTLDSSVSFFLILYFVFPFFFLNRPKNIIAAFMITVCCYLMVQFAGTFHLLFYSDSFYKYDAGLNYIDIGLSLTFIFSSLYAIKFMVWAYQQSISKKKNLIEYRPFLRK
ncbi:MAG: hypothetical protein ABI480_14470, partial [Chitinophagaceae bacterium]